MSDDDLEALIRNQPRAEPREELKGEVLAQVDAALSAERAAEGVLARPWPWAVAACALVGLLIVSLLMETGHAHRTATWRVARPSPAAPVGRAARGYLEGRALMLALLGEGSSDE